LSDKIMYLYWENGSFGSRVEYFDLSNVLVDHGSSVYYILG
jgi:hypothetical protein